MNEEEILAYLATDDGKKLADKIKQPLIDKRDELLGSVTTLKTQMTELQSAEATRLDEINATAREEEEKRLKSTNDFEAYKLFHEEELAKAKNQASEIKNKWAQSEVDKLVASTAASHSKSPLPLQLLLRDRVGMEFDENGQLSITVKDDKGAPMYYEGQPATMDHLVGSLKDKDDFAVFFDATGASGSGTSKPDSNSAVKTDVGMGDPGFNLTDYMAKNAAKQ